MGGGSVLFPCLGWGLAGSWEKVGEYSWGYFWERHEESSLGWYGGESQNHSPLVVAFLERLGIRSKRAVRENWFRHVRDPVLGVRQIFLFIADNSEPPNVYLHRGELFARCGSSTIRCRR
ncbi:hypothetical protein TNIN_35221 [Trichonephila inaurata madagascariensis]|uniref:Uncharacterized protein n=1 Tax=Trichonephila inaurata madagascariensis TaxID=2747483 RepID=A0A8X6ISU4_9ARAC|nr:hypothetical protein TNIN_35221 [Trichonephila inaurata madagascariensis]